MYSEYWGSARRHRPDHRRYPVVEGDIPLPLGSTCRRKRLRSAGGDGEEGRSCASRPNPEGLLSANELSSYGQPEEEAGLQTLCHRCHIVTSQLRRQAAALKGPSCALNLLDELQRPQWYRRSRRDPVDTRCDICRGSFHQLRRPARFRPPKVSREMTPRLGCPSAPAPTITSTRPASVGIYGPEELPVKQQRWSYEEQLGGGDLWGGGGVHSTYLGGGGAKGLAAVTRLPLNPQDYLEGVWRVSSRSPEHTQHSASWTSDAVYVTMKSLTQDVKPAAHSIATQTSRPPSTAAAFFIRAAQKLSLSHRKKSQPGPASPPGEGPGPLLYTGGFSGALQLSPPAIPPCLLRVGSKVKDKPGMGKVRVMVRICSDSTETTSLLKVDGRKKQLTLCELSASGLASTACRRAASAPKTFVFDAVFPHDASQAEVCSGTVAEVIQSVMNGADGCIFGFGHVNLGKTYTMIGRDCSTQSLGVAPTAIAWLFKVMDERKEKYGAEVTVRVSAVEISGREETLTDLLFEFSFPSSSAGGHQEAPSPGVSLREDPLCGSQLQNQTELQATNAKQAAFFLDAALAARRSSQDPSDQESRRNSHFLFTLHLYQERLDKTNKAAVLGRSRLHLMDLGSCETDVSRTREGGGGQCLSLSALGNVILALANGAKHIPYRDSKLTMLLSESLGNINCQTTMIAHISDSPATYMETLTTVQLASRIHRMRKKRSKYASSSSGGESSCEEGPSHRPPHLRPFHSRTVVPDPDIPLLLSSDTVYSSSSEHSCDTVIYIGPGGTAISDRELSDNEGPPSFVPIIPSLNKKRVKDAPRPVGDHFKCNTFAELQERLDFIDGSEGPAMFGTEGKTGQAAALRNQTGAIKPSEATAPLKSDKNSLQKFVESTTTTCANKTDPKQSPFPLESGLLDSSKIICTDGVKVSAASSQSCLVKPSGIFSQNSEPVVREKVYLKRGVPNSSVPPFMSRASRAASQLVDVVGRTPPMGMSPQALKQGHTVGSSNTERVHHTSRCTTEVDNLQTALLGPCFERDFLSTAVTLQQPVELNGEDELVFTVIEELPHCLVPDKGRPTNLLSFNSDNSRHESASGVRPVSIISSINDEYDAYISQHGAVGSDVGNDSGKSLFPQLGNMQSTVGSWPREGDADSIKSKGNHLMSSLFLRDKNIMKENASTPTSPSTSFKQPSLQTGIKSSLNDSGCFPSLDSNLATTNKLSLRKCSPSPDSTNVSLNFTLKMRAQVPHHGTLSSHPRKTKSASSGRQEGSHVGVFLQESSVDSREVEFLSACKPARNSINSSCSKRPGGNSNSIPRPLKAQASSSAERVVDGCDWSSTRRGDTLIKFSRLTRGVTLGTVSIPQVSESKWGCETTTGSLRFSSLGKQLNGQKSIVKSRSGYISSPAPPISQLSHDQKSRTLLSSSALKISNDFGRSSSPKISTSEEEVNLRLRGGSFCHRSSNVKTENGSARTSSLKTRGAKAESSRYYGSLISLESCVNQTLTGSKPELFRENSGASLANNRTNRSVPRLGVPASPSTSASPSQDPYAFATTIKVLGQAKGNSCSRAAVSGGTKVRSLSTSCSKSQSSPIKPLDNVVGRTSSLPSTVKSPSCSGTGAKTGKGTVMGTKQAISRAANSRVSELATGGQGKQLIGGPGAAGNYAVNSVNSSISGSLLNMPLPSPYSKITAPRRPQRYSSGHGSDNSSILSGELPPAMGRTALFYHSGGSSGYESMIRDSETTGSTSSAHDSMSESGVSSSNKSRVSKSPRKRGNGFQRRRLIPAPLPDTSTLGRRVGGQWVDLPPLGGTQKEPFEIKVYEIDDMEHLQRKREVVMDTEQPFQDVEKGLLYFNARLRMLEKRQQQIRELKSKHDGLKMELKEAKSRLMLNSSKWSSEFEVDKDLDRESQEYLEALAQATAELEYCVNLCKSHVMMETCFDIAVTTAAAATQREQQEVEV